MAKQELPKEFIKRLKAITAKRAKTVINHILKHGHITTEELSSLYGYDHPPRAARDVRELGIPLETFKITGSHGRKIGAYRFGDPSKVIAGKLGGRVAWPKQFKQQLIEAYGPRCAICLAAYESRYLQIDHRIPYEVGGDPEGELDSTKYMLVCGSCNRGKSWSCEHCVNWTDAHDESICSGCYWANPESYSHVAMRLIRRLDLTWTESEVSDYDLLLKQAGEAGLLVSDFVKQSLRRRLGRK